MIISTGYNGTPRHTKNCNDGGCKRCADETNASGTKLDECLCVHAEENAVVQAAYLGHSTQGATLFTSFCPCLYCAKSIINAGIHTVFYNEEYKMDESVSLLFAEAGVSLQKYGI